MRTPLLAPVLLTLLAGCGTTSESGIDAKSAPPGDIRVIRLEHAVPEDLAAALNSLLADNDSIRVVPHVATNSILVTGSEEEIVALLDLVARLDVSR